MGFATAFAVAGLIVAAPMAASAEETVVDPTTVSTTTPEPSVEPSSSPETQEVDTPASSGEVITPTEESAPDTSATTSDQTPAESPASSEVGKPIERAGFAEESAKDSGSPSPIDVSVGTSFGDAYCVPGGGARADVEVTVFPATAGILAYVRISSGVTVETSSGYTGGDGKYLFSVDIVEEGITNVAAGVEKSPGVTVGGDNDYTFPGSCAIAYVSPVGAIIDNTNQSVKIPEDPNFTYAVEGGEELQPGVHVLGPVGPGNIITTPKPGVTVDPNATTQWPFNFPPKPPKQVTPPALRPIGNHLPIPVADGVTYVDKQTKQPVTGTATLPDGVEQCFDAMPSGNDVTFTPGAATHWCFTYQPSSGGGTGGTGGDGNTGGSGDGGQGSTGGTTGNSSGTTTNSGSIVTERQSVSEPTRTLAVTGGSISPVLPLAAIASLIVGGLLLAFRRKQVV